MSQEDPLLGDHIHDPMLPRRDPVPKLPHTPQVHQSYERTCRVSTGNIWRRQSSVAFAVADASAAGYTFAFADNHDPDGDSNGTQITVSRP